MKRFRFKISGQNVEHGNLKANDASKFLMALTSILSEASLSINSEQTSDLVIKATNKGSFEFLMEIFQVLAESNQLNLTANDIVPSASIAQSLGFFHADGVTSLIELIKILKGKPITKDSIQYNKNTKNVVINGSNDGPITINNYTYNLYNSDNVRKGLNNLVQPLLDNPGYEKIYFQEENASSSSSSITKEEAEFFIYEETEEQVLESTIRTKIKVIKSVYEGKGQWTIKLENETVNAKISNGDWLSKFQTNQVDLPPRSIVEVTLKKHSFIKGDRQTKPPKYEIIEVHNIQRPPKQEKLI